MPLSSSLVLAIEPDSRQAAILKRVVRERAHAEITVVDSKDAAIAAIGARVPDLILVTALLSPRDEEDLVAHLRTLDEADHLQTITIPLLATAGSGGADEESGFFKKFRRKKNTPGDGVGCDPWAFADQVTGYLRTAADARAARQAALAFERSHDLTPLSDLYVDVSSQERERAPEAFGRSDPAADVAELREPPHEPEPVYENPSEELFNDPDYAFSWRSSDEKVRKSEGQKVGGSKVPGSGSKVPGSGSRVRKPHSTPEPEPIVLPPAPAEPIVSAIPEPEPVAAPIPEPEPIVAAIPEPEPIVAPIAEPEPIVALAPEPDAIFASEPEFVAPPPPPGPTAIEPEPEPVSSDRSAFAPLIPALDEFVAPSRAAKREPVAPPEPVVSAPEPVAPAPPAKPAKSRGWRWGKKAAAPVEEPAPAAARAPEPPPAPRTPPAPVVLRPLKRLPPLAMWARFDEPIAAEAPSPPPHARHEDDDVAALIGGLRVPGHVLAVSYPRRPYIHRVRSVAA